VAYPHPDCVYVAREAQMGSLIRLVESVQAILIMPILFCTSYHLAQKNNRSSPDASYCHILESNVACESNGFVQAFHVFQIHFHLESAPRPFPAYQHATCVKAAVLLLLFLSTRIKMNSSALKGLLCKSKSTPKQHTQ